MRHLITNHIRAGYPALYLVSSEEARVEAELKAIADSLEYGLYAWSVTEGLLDTSDGCIRDASDPQEVLAQVDDLPENSILLLRDLHQFLEDGNPYLTRLVKDAARSAKSHGKVLVVLGCRLELPPELQREFAVIEFALPSREELGIVLDNIAHSADQDEPNGENREALLDAATGLTSVEAENAYALSVIEVGRLDPGLVAREKAQTIKKNGLLEICEPTDSLEDIGGLDALKDWLLKRKDAFGQPAQDYGLPSPKGLLIIGIPGTGKSLTAKATARVFNRPLLKLDAGRLFAGLVGQSEGNLRNAIQTAEAIAPCVLWVDEIEKGFSGSRSSGATDGGTSSRVFGSFISWMQERTSPVFVVATANDVTQLPPEMLRKGRFDELFFVDLPNQDEREAIWRIQVKKYGRDPDQLSLCQLAGATNGFTGSEIEQTFIDALYEGFSRHVEPTDLSISMVLNNLVPLSKLMADQIGDLRKWARGRARLATPASEHAVERKIQIKSESASG